MSEPDSVPSALLRRFLLPSGWQVPQLHAFTVEFVFYDDASTKIIGPILWDFKGLGSYSAQEQLGSIRRGSHALAKEMNHDVVTLDDSEDFVRYSTVGWHFIVVPTWKMGKQAIHPLQLTTCSMWEAK